MLNTTRKKNGSSTERLTLIFKRTTTLEFPLNTTLRLLPRFLLKLPQKMAITPTGSAQMFLGKLSTLAANKTIRDGAIHTMLNTALRQASRDSKAIQLFLLLEVSTIWEILQLSPTTQLLLIPGKQTSILTIRLTITGQWELTSTLMAHVSTQREIPTTSALTSSTISEVAS